MSRRGYGGKRKPDDKQAKEPGAHPDAARTGLPVAELDVGCRGGNTLMALYKRRVICNALVLAMVVTSLGTDCLSQASVIVRADAVVNVAGKMASRFTRAFPRRVQQTTIHFARRSESMTPEPRPMAAATPAVHQSLIPLQRQYLPPPARA